MPSHNKIIHFLVSALNGKVLDVEGGRAQAGDKVILYTKKDPPAPNQLWFAEDCGGGYFHIVSEANPHCCLDVENEEANAGAKICIWDKKYPAASNQMFRWNGQSIISALGSHLALDVENGSTHDGARIILWDYHGGVNQRFTPLNVPVVHFLVSRLNGKVMDVEGGQGRPGSKVIVYSKKYPAGKNQLFYTEDLGNGYFYIIPECNRNCVLDVENESAKPGANLCIWDRKSPPARNQMFAWRGNTIVSAMGSHLALDVEGAQGNDGDRIILWDWHGNANQQWERQSS